MESIIKIGILNYKDKSKVSRTPVVLWSNTSCIRLGYQWFESQPRLILWTRRLKKETRNEKQSMQSGGKTIRIIIDMDP